MSINQNAQTQINVYTKCTVHTTQTCLLCEVSFRQHRAVQTVEN